jgi:hypothetical protein
MPDPSPAAVQRSASDRLPRPRAAWRRHLPRAAAWRVTLVAAAGGVSIAANWLRWISPFVDSGREMNVPARLAAGERLYRDIVFYYGPAGPWLQALALRLWPGGGRPRLPPGTALPAVHSWLPLEIACLTLSAAILVLLYRLTAVAGGKRSALAGTTLAAAFCIAAPRGGGFVFPYSASSLYALAGALLALDASLRPSSWRRRALVAAGIALALTARFEIGAAATLILLVASLRSREADPGERAAGAVDAAGRGAGGAGPRAVFRSAVADLSLGVAAAAAVYAVAFAGIPWRLLLGQGPLTHMLAMPPEWKGFYGNVSGLARLDRTLPQLAWGLGLDALVLVVCALSLAPRSAAAAGPVSSRSGAGPSPPAAGPAPCGHIDPDRRRGWRRSSNGGAALLRVLFCAAVAAGVTAFARWGGPRRWPWGRISDALPPLLFPLPLFAAAAALAVLRRPLDESGRARFLLFGFAAALAIRVLLGLEIGPEMAAYCALPLALLLASAAVIAGDLLAPRLRDPGGFRFRLAALAAGLTALYLFRVAALAWGPHIVRLETSAGTLRVPWKEAFAIEGTLGYLAGRAHPGDALASFPEAGFFNFVTGLRNPMREEEIFPGVLGSGREAEAIARLLTTRPRFVLLANRPTPEFGARAFGEDYATCLWTAVEDHYSLAATFGNAREGAPIGGRRFFIRVYEPSPAPGGK